jgi:hypothetical protein
MLESRKRLTVSDIRSQVFPRHSIPPCPPTQIPLFHIGPSPSTILGRHRPLSPQYKPERHVWSSLATPFRAYIVLPVVVEIILIQKAFTKTKTELGQADAVWVI